MLSFISFLTAPCIGLFFMVSGALLLPTKDGTKVFLTRRFSKVAYPTIFWSLFYIAVNHILDDKPLEIGTLAKQVFSIPFAAQGHGVMWFMYVLAGLYLITPILSPWIKSVSKRALQFYLALWLLAMCYPILGYSFMLNESNTGILYYFSGYVGYFVLGYYLKRYQPRISKFMALMLLVIPFAVATTCKLAHVDVDFYSMFWYLSIFSVMMCVAWFSLISRSEIISRISGRLKSLIISFSNCSFGVYLIHIFVMRQMLWNCEFIYQMGGYCK
jgi:surface polysaccharide O-acyltransferase-like enzyme